MNNLLFYLEVIGVIAFAISGAMVAIEEKLDVFGVVVLGFTTALGGGMLRDLMLGNLPSVNFYNYTAIALSIFVSIFIFVLASITSSWYRSHIFIIEKINNAADALGLGVFIVSGIQIALARGYGENLFLVIFSGLITGAGGGTIRDIMVGRKPVIFSRHIYAVAAIIGGMYFLACLHFRLPLAFSMTSSIVLVFVIRMLSAHYRWNLPRIV